MKDEVSNYLKRIGLDQETLNREYNVYILSDKVTDHIVRGGIKINLS